MTTAPIPEPRLTAERRAVIEQSFRELRVLLGIAKNGRPKEWQELVARHVSALCADFPGQSDATIALGEIALVALAAQKGSSDAKKRVLKPVRWISEKPPDITETFESLEEARAAIRVLQPIKADWVAGYIQGELAKNKWSPLMRDFLAWQLKVSASLEAFLKSINDSPIPRDSSAAGWVAPVLHAVHKLLAKSRVESGAGYMAEIERLAVKCNALGGGEPTAIQRDLRAAQRWIVALVSQTASVDPTVLLQGGAVAAVRSIAKLSKVQDHVAASDFDLLCRRLIALMTVLVPLADRVSILHYRNLWTAYRECAPRAGQLLKNAIRENPALGQLESPLEEGVRSDYGVTHALEGVVTELISNWDSYFAQHREDPAVQQLSARIDDMVKQLGIVRFGAEGEILPYDPLRHDLPDHSSEPPARVIVKKRGIALERPDGTSRTLLAAIVVPARDG